MFESFIDNAIKANQKIYKLIENGLSQELLEPTSRGAGGDISLKIDLLAEKIFVEHLNKYGEIISEESGVISGDKNFQIILDPIDGSDNLLSNVPYFGTSIALKKDEKTVLGIVTNLANGEIFIKDSHNFQRGKLDKLVFKKVINNPFAKLGFFERSYCSKNLVTFLKEHRLKYRSPGAFALSLAYAHDVDFVVYEGFMREYDIAAGEFFCEDLYKLKTDQFLLVSKNKETFDKISKFIL
jgi:myo-inositol-1(or 4)-monophosphatase